MLCSDLSTAVHLFRYGKEVCDAIAAKCLTGRPKTVEKAVTAFMLWVELEAVDGFLVSVLYSQKVIFIRSRYSSKASNFLSPFLRTPWRRQ